MSILDIHIIETRHQQGEAIKSKDMEVLRRKKFQEDDSLWNETQLTINGFEENKFNLSQNESMLQSQNHSTKQKYQNQSVVNINRLRSLKKQSFSRSKIIDVEQSNKSEIQNSNQLCNNILSNYCSNYWQNTGRLNTIKINTLFNSNPIFFKNLTMLTKIKLKMRHFYKNYTSIQRSRFLNKSIRLMINDLSDIIATNEGYFKNWFTSLKKYSIIRLKIPLFKLSSKIGFYTKLIIALINIIYLFLFSIFIVFQVKDSFSQIISLLIIYVWIIDFLFNLNCQVYSDNDIISNQSQARLTYLKNKFIFDFLPFLLNSQLNSSSLFLQLFQFLKLFNILQDLKYIQLQLCMRVKKHFIIQLINLIFSLFFIGHIIACMWYIIGYIEANYFNDQNSWILQSQYQNQAWWQMYFQSLYWSLTLMSTGSNSCFADLEIMFTTIILLFTSIFFGYVVTVIGDILSEMNTKQLQEKQDTNTINKYMRQNWIPKQKKLIQLQLK